MRIRSLDINGDWQYGNGLQDYNRKEDALKTNVETRLKSFRTDCFFAEAEGVDYFSLLSKGTKELLDQDVKRIILQTEGVVSIVFYQSEVNTTSRNFTVQATISTIYGTIGVKVEV